MNHAATTRYLRQYAEPESRVGSSLLRPHIFEHVIVIPAFQETWQALTEVWQHLDARCLIILVANSPLDRDSATWELISEVRSNNEILGLEPPLTYLKTPDGVSILLVDRCSRPIPANKGVGLARKIGADIALQLIDSGLVRQPWIFNTDADVILPMGYFESADFRRQDIAAVLYPFRHLPAVHAEACFTYEISLFYYVAGLHHAGSPYAFNTVGSTIAISAPHYAKVRGFPVRNAGEDFYLLNKLAKTGKISQLPEPCIEISARLSHRVPFGTGTGIRKILELARFSDYLFYNPAIFDCLNQLLTDLKSCQQSAQPGQHFATPEIADWCHKAGLIELIVSKQSQRREVFDKFIHDWMDGFRTLKFIHFFRDHHYASLPWAEVKSAAFLPGFISDDLQQTRNRLQHHSLQKHRV